MQLILTPQAILGALLIFALRVGDMSLDTIRVLFVVRGKKRLSWVLGFFQSLIFVIAIGSVLSNLKNPLNILGYAAGFATGNVLGMLVEERLAIGHVHFTIMSPLLGACVAEKLRENGFGVTEIPARGRDGTVAVLNVNVNRRDKDMVERVVLDADPEAFVTTDDVRRVRRGFWGA